MSECGRRKNIKSRVERSRGKGRKDEG